MDGTVLVMDYSEYDRKKINKALCNIGSFKIDEFSCFNQYSLSIDELTKPDLIIMDIAFPSDREGFSILTDIRKKFDPGSIPVIIITNNDNLSHKSSASQFGVCDYIIKPFQGVRLENSIRSIIKIKDKFKYSTSGIQNIAMSFEEFIDRELKTASRIQRPLSLILITSIKGNLENVSDEPEGISDLKRVFLMLPDKIKSTLRATDTAILNMSRDIIIILPCTDSISVKAVSEKIRLSSINDVTKINLKYDECFYSVNVTFPDEGKNFQELMECAFKKVEDKIMLERMASISINSRNYAEKRYNQFRRWF